MMTYKMPGAAAGHIKTSLNKTMTLVHSVFHSVWHKVRKHVGLTELHFAY